MACYDFDLTEQVKKQHVLCDINETVNVRSMVYRLKDLETKLGRHGYGVEVGLKCLFLQFYDDVSDRQLEQEFRFNIAYKWFCGFRAYQQTADHA